MFQIAICDDDQTFLDRLETLISQRFLQDGHVVTITTYLDGRNLIEAVEKQAQIFDVVFLDVEMPAISGFQVAQKLRQLSKTFLLIFTTFLESQARQGYTYNAYRYIFKNQLETELNEAIAAILARLRLQAVDDAMIELKYRCLGVLETLEVKKSDILYLRLEKNRRVTLKTVFSTYDLLTKPLSEYAKLLATDSFYLVMRNYLVNFHRVADILTDEFVMEDGEKIPLGATRETQKVSKEKYMQFLEERL